MQIQPYHAQPDTASSVSGVSLHTLAITSGGATYCNENRVLRKPPIEEVRTLHSTYSETPQSSQGRETVGLPIGTQQRFIKAAELAASQGSPINRLLTIRWTSLFSSEEVNWLRAMPTHEQIALFVERVRKWLIHRGMPAFYIWVREATASECEHWHIGLHLRARLDREFARYIGHLTGERPLAQPRSSSLGEIARSELGSWQIAKDTTPQRRGYFLAAYLGKAEPSVIEFRGKPRPNTAKPVRGIAFGGAQGCDKYDAPQGIITGSFARGRRFHISKPLQSAMAR